MRIALLSRFAIPALLAISIISCNKSEQLETDKLEDVMPVAVGKYITYRLDSTVFVGQTVNAEIHRYQVKHVVEAELTDNLGRPAYRVYRYINDSTASGSWIPNGSYYITPLNDQIEVIDDNLRIIKLHLPFKDGFSWKGNRYLGDDAYEQKYTFSNDDNMFDWDFYYDGGLQSSVDINGHTYNDVYTIIQDDEAYNFPVIDISGFAARSYSEEKYAKGIGLIYRDLLLWEQQPNQTGTTFNPYRVGFGIRMWMIDHN